MSNPEAVTGHLADHISGADPTAGQIVTIIAIVFACVLVYVMIGAIVAGIASRCGLIDDPEPDAILTAVFWPLVVVLVFPVLLGFMMYRLISGEG